MFNGQSIFSVTQILGYLACFFGISAFLFKSDRALKIFSALECFFYVIHFFMLGSYTSSLITFMAMLRSLVSLKARDKRIAYVFIAVNVVVGGSLVKEWVNVLPIFASCMATYSLFFFKGVKMRVPMLCGATLWFINNLITGSIGGAVHEGAVVVLGSMTVYRLIRQERNAALHMKK